MMGRKHGVDARGGLAELVGEGAQGLQHDGRVAAVAEAPAQLARDLARLVGKIGDVPGRKTQERAQALELAARFMHDGLGQASALEDARQPREHAHNLRRPGGEPRIARPLSRRIEHGGSLADYAPAREMAMGWKRIGRT